jgi:putative ABC transport system substrate-binding protein
MKLKVLILFTILGGLLINCQKRSDIYTIGVCEFADHVLNTQSEEGFFAALKDAGVVLDKDVKVVVHNAQGEFSTVTAIAQKLCQNRVNQIFCLGSPCLQNCIQQTKEIPIIFTEVANPYVAGAGESAEQHLPNVTGVATTSPFRETFILIRKMFPNIRTVGTLYAPAEPNSEYYKETQRKTAAEYGLKVVTVPVNSTSELTDAAMALVLKEIDAIYQISDHISTIGFEAIVKAANGSKLPLFCNQINEVERGAAVGLGWDFFEAGYQGGVLALRVMRGENPSNIPIQNMQNARLALNLSAAKLQGLDLPAELISSAAVIIR